jgi:tetratricopeptide (TPR) repeat protein
VSRRILASLLILEVALILAYAWYALAPAETPFLGSIVQAAFGSLPLLLFCALTAGFLILLVSGARTRSHPVLNEESRTLLDLQEKAKVSPSSYNLFRLASFCEKTSRYPHAVEAYRRVLEEEPGRVSARYGLGISLFRSGRVEEAITELEAVRASDPQALLRRGEAGNARAVLLERRSCFGLAEYHFLMGDALRKLGDFEDARRQLLRVIEAAAASSGARREKDLHLAQLARQSLLAMADPGTR